MAKIIVKDTEISVVKVNDEDYICLTDMLRAKDGDFFITDWLRNRNTLNISAFGRKFTIPFLIMANSPQLEINRDSTVLRLV